MIYFTADLHLGHKNIIKYSNRPFSTVEEMDKTLIDNWNARVADNDTVYVVGDFALAPLAKVIEYIKKLKGFIVFVNGSHDRWIADSKNGPFHPRAIILKDRLHEVKGILSEKKSIILCHYAMRTWPKSHYGSWHLYGHSHGNLPGHGYSFDIGVDCNSFVPVSLEQVEQRMSKITPPYTIFAKKADRSEKQS